MVFLLVGVFMIVLRDYWGLKMRLYDYKNTKEVIFKFWDCNIRQDYTQFNFLRAFEEFCLVIEPIENKSEELLNLWGRLGNAKHKYLGRKETVILFDSVIHLQHQTNEIFEDIIISDLRCEFEGGFEMRYKIRFMDDLIMEIESVRAISGDYDQLVYFWDCVKDQRFDSVEEVRDFIDNKIDSVDKNKVKIEEENERN
ncbi:MAG: hypothetical protein ACTSQH_00120 [Candidatus Hodarchaeales archaeon]